MIERHRILPVYEIIWLSSRILKIEEEREDYLEKTYYYFRISDILYIEICTDPSTITIGYRNGRFKFDFKTKEIAEKFLKKLEEKIIEE